MTGHLPGEWKLADHPEHGRVLVIHVSGDTAVYAVPYKPTGLRTHVVLVSDLTFVDTDWEYGDNGWDDETQAPMHYPVEPSCRDDDHACPEPAPPRYRRLVGPWEEA